MSVNPQQSPDSPAPRFVSRQWLSQRWSISEPTIIRMEQRGELKPVFLGARLVRYRLEDIEALEGEGERQKAEARSQK